MLYIPWMVILGDHNIKKNKFQNGYQSGYHGVTEIAKTANVAKMAEKCINCTSARPTPPHTNPMESGPGNTFLAQNKKEPKDS